MKGETTISGKRAALVIAHPGHELRVHGWLERAKPLVFVLTDGSGSQRESRLEHTTRLLESVGATSAVSTYGRFTDRQLYDALLAGDHVLFRGLVGEITREIGAVGDVAYVVCDALEEYNTGHDLCHLIAGAVAREAGLPLYDFPLIGRPDACPAALEAGALRLCLDDAALARKIAAARANPDLTDEVERALATVGADAFRVECLRPVPADAADRTTAFPAAGKPHYEVYGEKQVAAGLYDTVIRRAEHVAPLAAALRKGPSPGSRATA